MVVKDRYIDNMREYEQELALAEFEEQEPYTEEQIEEMYQDNLYRQNIGNPMKLYGAI